MKLIQVNYDQVPHISKRDLAYIKGDERLRPFYKYDFDFGSFEEIINDRKSFPVNRSLLVETLQDQYKGVKSSQATQANIDALATESTFTIITAHQPSLLTGPLYFIYKICSVINLCKRLSEQFPTNKFVPTFILGAEDHDFEEINHFKLFGKTISWETDQKGAVGRMKVDGIRKVLDDTKDILGTSPNAAEIISIFEESLVGADNYYDFVFNYVNRLFSDHGLVIVNMDNAALKGSFAPIIKKEILEQLSEEKVNVTIADMEAAGFKGQATPRAINFFYLSENSRERIVFEEDQYKVLNTAFTFTKDEMLSEIDNHPERFSPNVIVRPLYQEYTLPNLAYVGGGGELAYWTERKSQFEEAGIFFPMLIRRNSVQWNDGGILKQQAKLGLSSLEFLKGEHHLIKDFIAANSEQSLDLTEEKKSLEEIYARIAEKAKAIEAPLEKYVMAEQAKQLKAASQIEGKLVKAIKQKHDVSLNKIKSVKEKQFPDQSLQERKNNFLQQYIKHGQSYIDFLVTHLDPFNKQYLIVEEG